ncbi:hypothetical protein BN946_scf184962.g9 [Trametes cinnabarina]|uniref:60S acidic ribosomal protein P2 n=1 Tax=Pycnoporus cinnabarinus TaxID=5643 RepID=A0A060SCV6_PYCCI|nr:hypothetical protein BN946_scf184962.g9 [Trametes cinnabarina]
MRHLATYLLFRIGEHASPSAADVKDVLGAVSVQSEFDDARLEKIIHELQGGDIDRSSRALRSSLCSAQTGSAAAKGQQQAAKQNITTMGPGKE